MRITEYLEKGQAVTLAFLGDSVTHGYFESFNGMHGTVDYDAVYHNRLKKELLKVYPDSVITVINAGVGGDTAGSGLKRLENDVIRYHPDLTVVCYGLNDIHNDIQDYTDALDSIFARLTECESETVLMTPNMLNTYVDVSLNGGLREIAQKTEEYQNSGKMDSFIEAAMATAEARKIVVCDCYSKWKEMYQNGVDTTALLANKINHPNREMHWLFARELLDLLERRVFL